MIKVYVNGEYYVRFDNQEQLDSWVQKMDDEFFFENSVQYKYEQDRDE
jgi:hypothetical protein